MERNVEKALKKRIRIEWQFNPDAGVIQDEYSRMLNAIINGFSSGHYVGIIKLKDSHVLPKEGHLYLVEPNNSIKKEEAREAAEIIISKHARELSDPSYEIAILEKTRLVFPLRPDLSPAYIKSK